MAAALAGAVRLVSGAWLRWLPIALGLIAMYVPTYIALAGSAWKDEQNAHGPLVLLIVVWLAWRQRDALAALPQQSEPYAGWPLLAFGLACYAFGRIVELVYLEAFSQIPVLTGALTLLYGRRGVRVMAFPLLYLVFLVPLPGVMIDAATGPLKQTVSVIAESLLYSAGYPVARSGVVLTIGQYQLLVADACSGMNSIYTLSALGLLFIYLTGDRGRLKTAILLASIWPIAFAANIVRVIALVLITYHLGDEAGQGFLHGFSGMLLFVVSLLSLFALKAVLDRTLPATRGKTRP